MTSICRLSMVCLAATVTVLSLLSPAAAFKAPPAADIVRRVKRSVIRIQGIPVSASLPNAGIGGGSGVVFQIDYDSGTAYALTNHHVSGDAFVNSVRFWDGAEYRAELIATEPGIDAALIKIYGVPDERSLPMSERTITASPLGDSQSVLIGDYAIAMGSPGAADGIRADRDDPYQDLMLQQTVTSGVVTGRDSDIDFQLGIWQQNRDDLGQQYGTNFDYAFRITVPINGGNSGGPLFNDKGEVIGLNFYGGSNTIMQNSNHTVPIHLAKDFAFQVLNTGKFEKPWLGLDMLFPPHLVYVSDIRELRKKQAKIGASMQIFGVRPGSSAERAGFRKGDIVLSVNGRSFTSPEALRTYVFEQKIGSQMVFDIKRNGSRLENPIVVEVVPKRFYDSEFSI